VIPPNTPEKVGTSSKSNLDSAMLKRKLDQAVEDEIEKKKKKFPGQMNETVSESI